MRLKVIYISSAAFLDLDLSFVKAMSKHVDLYFLFDLYPHLLKATALDIDKVYDEAGIRPASDYAALMRYSHFFDPGKTWVINRTHKSWSSPTNARIQGILSEFINELNPDIVHFNNHVYFNHFYLFLQHRKRIIINVHDPFPHSGDILKFKAKIQRFVNNKLVRNHVLLNDEQKDMYISENSLHNTNIVRSSLGVYEYLADFPDTREPELKSDILFFGRISPYKGLDDLLDAFRQVLDRHPETRLIIAGSGSFWFDVDDYGIPEKNLLVLNRYITSAELSTMIRNTRFVVCPYTDATQSGVIMTAYALCKPVIATRVGGLAEMVIDGETGLLVDPKDNAQLAQAIDRLLQDKTLLDSMETAIGDYYYTGSRSWDAIARSMVDTYNGMIGR